MDVGNNDFRFQSVAPVNGGYELKEAKTIRHPTTAELHIKSLDRYDQTATVSQVQVQLTNATSYPGTYNTGTQFNVTQKGNVMNGYFNRVALSEIYLQWRMPTIIAGYNDSVWMYCSWTALAPLARRVTVPAGYYSVSALATAWASAINTAFGLAGGTAVSIATTPNGCGMTLTAPLAPPPAGGATCIYIIPFWLGGSTQGTGVQPLADWQNGIQTTQNVLISYRFARLVGAGRAAFGFLYPNGAPVGTSQQFLYYSRVAGVGNLLTWTCNCANLMPTNYIDIQSRALTRFKKVIDTNTTQNSLSSIIHRYYLTSSDQAFTPITAASSGQQPYNVAKIITNPNWSEWSPGQAFGQIDITLLDQWGEVIPWSTSSPTEISLTLLLSES